MATKRERIEKNIVAITEKIQQLQTKLEVLQQERKKLIDMEILNTVHSVQVTPEELQTILSKMQKTTIIQNFQQSERKEDFTHETKTE